MFSAVAHELLIPRSILALDFDGVICDGMEEYLASSWQVYQRLWPTSTVLSPDLAAAFRRWRSIIEYGWEMPLLLRAIVQSVPSDRFIHQWPSLVSEILAQNNLTSATITHIMDEVRDQAISQNLETWLELQRCYPGTVEMLLHLPPEITPVIVTTKDGRFTRQMLERQGVQLPEGAILGKETRQPKTATLKQLLARNPEQIWFVEDRLPTLVKVSQDPALNKVQLFLADWGYNNATDRQAAATDPRITTLTLAEFCQNPYHWSAPCST